MGSEAGPASIKFYLTGFKKFHNVADNPTEFLVEHMKQFIKDRSLSPGATLESCTVLETAGAGALDFLLTLLDSTSSSSVHNSGKEGEEKSDILPQQSSGNAQVVWVHLGVNSGACKFAVEQRAVNEATFRCPDEMGWQPDGMPIVAEDGPISNVRETKFPVGKIVSELVKQGFDLILSNDAGRFVCNYVYYQSLRHAANHGTMSLFVHVPPFAVIDGNTQLEFVVALLNVLASIML